MGHPSPHSNWVHLYLNGLYWGVYNPTERPDAGFASSYLGGERDEFDILKNHEEVIDGNGDAYAELLALIQQSPTNFSLGYRDFLARGIRRCAGVGRCTKSDRLHDPQYVRTGRRLAWEQLHRPQPGCRGWLRLFLVG